MEDPVGVFAHVVVDNYVGKTVREVSRVQPDTTSGTSLRLDFFLHLFFMFLRSLAFESAHGRLIELVDLFFDTRGAQVRDANSEGLASTSLSGSGGFELDLHSSLNFWRAFEVVL